MLRASSKTIRLSAYVKRWIFLDLLGGLAGVAVGLGAVIFRITIDLNHHLIFDKVFSKISLDFDGFDLGIILARASRVEVGEVAPRVLTVTHKDETVHSALDKMHEKGVGRFPVIDKENLKRILGIIYNNDILRIREIASQRLVE